MKLTCLESYLDKNHNHYGCFLIEPLESGQGITLGNSLRRTLLSDLSGFAITGVRINNVKHEFTNIPGIREDILEILLNLKEILFKESLIFQQQEDEKNNKFLLKGFLNVKGPITVTAGMFKLPKDSIKIVNLNQYICTILEPSELYIEIDIEKGKSYRLLSENRKKKHSETLFPDRPSTLPIDALFMPIKKVNFKIRLIHDTQGNIKESLIFEIVTNTSITPKRALQEGLKILMNIFYSVFLNIEVIKTTQEFKEYFTHLKTDSKKFLKTF